jgi:ubiquinone/menaquinone biosynthesis C-methylase UbiE
MSDETYYRDHWVDIEPERLERYDEMFQWRPEMEPLLEPACIVPGLSVVDYGCGPGALTVELADRIGAHGRVHAVDLNAELLEMARRRADDARLEEHITFHHITEDSIPLADDSVDRVVCKNVLEYVDDLGATLSDFRRVTRTGGLVHAIDSDWGMLTVEPLGAERMSELFAAASAAYREPLVGRKLYGAMRTAGFREVKVRIITGADTRGYLSFVVKNMTSYATELGAYDSAKAEELLADLDKAIADETWLAVLPQFLVTGTA